jgi:outer membrane receptor protein involved in Fe transport
VVSNQPTSVPYGRVTAAVEEFGGMELSGVISGPTSDSSAYRLAVKHYDSDGFTEDIFLDRKDTNNIDETTARASFTNQVNDQLVLDFVLFLADIDNGYDAFSLDNTRQTYSDQPGFDRQETTAGSIKARYQINDDLAFEGLLSLAKSDTEYAFDEDWSNLGICDNAACDSDLFGFDWFYSSFDDYRRSNDNTSLDIKLVSSNDERSQWVLGFYHRDQDINLSRVYTFAAADFASTLNTKNTAIYGQFSHQLNDRLALTTGLRLEQRDVDYADSTGARANPDEDLWGGRLALEYLADNGAFYYGLISRGYKPGGFNLDGSIPTAQREFDTETMINYEIGLKQSFSDGAIRLQVALFYQDRDDIQSKQSIVASIAAGELGGNCPCSFTDFTANAASGSNKGLEVEIQWSATERFNLFATLGLLDTEFNDFLTFEHINADRDNGVAFNLDGREQAHAPGYQWVIGGDYALTNHWSISGSIEAKDDFFFSDRHEERSDANELLNLELSYTKENWRVALYGKNLSDELVKTRGFGSFGNDPRNFYATQAYNQFGAPRVVGLKASLEF